MNTNPSGISARVLSLVLRRSRGARRSCGTDDENVAIVMMLCAESKQHIKPDALEVTDFSATIDLYSTVEYVYSMGHFQVSPGTVRELLVVTTLPFVPVILTAVPVGTILDNIVKLLI